MFEVELYETRNGYSEVFEFLEELRAQMATNKDARIQYKQAVFYTQLLEQNGTKGLPVSIAEHLEGEIWELRPGNNRIFFFFFNEDETYVLLHHFRKKTQKTPASEINKAKLECEDYKAQRAEEKEGK